MKNCKNPTCKKQRSKDSAFCCEECRINYECVVLNPRKSQAYFEELAIAKAKKRVQS